MQTTYPKNEKINLDDTVSFLGVSSATVRNWIKHEYLTPDRSHDNKLVFDYFQVYNLKEKISNGEIDRLNKRANKKQSSETFVPDEYADNFSVLDFVNRILDVYRSETLDIHDLLFVVTLNLLKNRNLITYPLPFKTECISSKNPHVEDEISWWAKRISNRSENLIYLELLSSELPQIDDLLGLIYQSIRAEGNKAQTGSYYTPRSVVNQIVDKHVKEFSIVLDPCCGTGQFILSASEKITDPKNVWGFDIDEIAVRIARLNLIMKYSDRVFSPNIFHKNTLLDLNQTGLFAQDIPTFDVVITNPPWGVHFTQDETLQLQQIYPSIQSNEAFSYFIDAGLKSLKQGGVLSYILPESILNIKTHRDIREVILRQTKLTSAYYLNRVFKNVFTPVIRLDVTKETPSDSHQIEVNKDDTVHVVKQTRLLENNDYIFDIFSNDQDVSIIDKVYRLNHVTLENSAEWALGIVTGDNKKHVSAKKEASYEPILTGKDIKRFLFDNPKNYIKFKPENFQQVAPENKYRAKEKLLYKFISKELVFSYDNNKTLSLNSANILIPKLDNYPVKTILAFFNSSLYQFVHQKKFASLKVLRSDIEKLPLPILDKDQHKKVISLVDYQLDRSNSIEDRKHKYAELDRFILDLFLLTDTEKNHIVSNTGISDRLLSIE